MTTLSYKTLAGVLLVGFVVAGCANDRLTTRIATSGRIPADPPPAPIAKPPAPPSFSRRVQLARAAESDITPGSMARDYYTVRRGDTAFGVARSHGVPFKTLVAVNRLRSPYRLSPGQQLALPAGAWTSPPAVPVGGNAVVAVPLKPVVVEAASTKRAAPSTHVVRRGDTLYGVARRYGLKPQQVAAENRLSAPYALKPGQRLAIPGDSPNVSQTQVAAAPQHSDSPRVTLKMVKNAINAATSKTEAPRPVAVGEPPARSQSQFLWPVRGKIISNFGAKRGGLKNDGINIAAPRGTKVLAAENGVVAYAGNELRGFGNLLLIKHADGWVSAYAHNEAIVVRRGQRVRRGQAIARVGSTGSVSEPQLHFELRKGSRALNPADLLGPRQRAAIDWVASSDGNG